MNRRFTFSDDANIDVLSREFIPCVANTHEVQFGKTNASDWFAKIVRNTDNQYLRRQTTKADEEGTIQGLYIFAADGTPYGWMNDNDPREVERFLAQGLKSFEEHPPSNGIESVVSDKWNKADPSTSIVRIFTRIRPTKREWPVLNFGVGRDHLWILKEELEEIVKGTATGDRVALPRNLVERLCRYHLVDNVRGEPDMWNENETKERNFQVHRIWCSLDVSAYEIDGSYWLETDDRKRGVKGDLNGVIEIDHRSMQVKKFRAIGNATAWGQSRFTPDPPPGKFRLVFGMKDVDDEISRNVPPQGIAWGDYLSPEGD